MNRWFCASLGYFAFVVLALTLTHPFWTVLRIGYRTPMHWVQVYLGMAFVIFVVTLLIVTLTRICLPSKRRLASILVGVLICGVLAAYSQWVGVALTAKESDELLLSNLNHFFRNFRSIAFTFVNAPIFGVAAGLLYAYLSRGDKARQSA